MKKQTLRNRINRLTIGSLFIVGTIIFFSMVGYSYVKYSIFKIASFKTLKTSIANQIQQILPALLVDEQRGGLVLHLDKIKFDEDLSEIQFVPFDQDNLIKSKIGECEYLMVTTECQIKDSIVVVIPVGIGGKNYGHLVKVKKIPAFSMQNQQLYFIEVLLSVLILIFSIQFFIISRLTSKEVPNSLNSLLEWVNSELSTSGDKLSKPNLQFEEFSELAEKISILIKENERQKVQAKVGLMASQVSHDIRSPLAALSLIMNDLSQISEEKRVIIRSAVNRINDIANHLLKLGQKPTGDYKHWDENGKQFEPALVMPIVDSIVSEKRIQIRDKQSLEILSNFDNSYGIFVKIDTTELKRVLSNILQNSIESFEGKSGRINVLIDSTDKYFSISIVDTGKGIPPHILSRLGCERLSYGKDCADSGSGLGIFHAKQFVETNGGKFQVQSKVFFGTTVKMTFLREVCPEWFVDKIFYTKHTIFVSIDDDISIHHLWNKKIFTDNFVSSADSHITFTSCFEFKEKYWNNEHLRNSEKTIFLMDYEFLNQGITGLDIIEELGIGNRAILVTSYYDDESIVGRCKKLGVKLVPKTMAGFVPFEKVESIPEYILIDNDPLVHSVWKLEAKLKNKNLLTFFSYEDFFIYGKNINFSTVIFIDSDFGDAKEKGEIVAKRISELGFKNIYLSTGFNIENPEDMPWIKKTVGKAPVFI